MDYLITQFGPGIAILILLASIILSLSILYLVIKSAVSSAMGDSNYYSKQTHKEITEIRKILEKK
jgi:hypothetical protein